MPYDDSNHLNDILRRNATGAHAPRQTTPVRPQRRPSPTELAGDNLARQEAEVFENGGYDKLAQRNKLLRDQSAKNWVHWASMFLVGLAVAMFAGLNIVWFLHRAIGFKFLPPDDLSLIQNVIAAIWVGKIGMHLERYAHRHGPEE